MIFTRKRKILEKGFLCIPMITANITNILNGKGLNVFISGKNKSNTLEMFLITTNYIIYMSVL